MSEPIRYPLAWPPGWPRTDHRDRKSAKFSKIETRESKVTPGYMITARNDLTIAQATKRVMIELDRLRAGNALLSTNLQLNLDGTPRSTQRKPDDPGAAVYWWAHGESESPKVMAIDIYDTVAGNIAAIAATLEAMRAIERHGGAQVLERAFTGFDALPAPLKWWEVLKVRRDADIREIRPIYLQLLKIHHPDNGGSQERAAEINRAWEEAQKARMK